MQCNGAVTGPAPVVLSHFQAESLLESRKAGLMTSTVSSDLGRSVIEVLLGPVGVGFPGGLQVSWAVVQQISKNDNNCFLIDEHGCRKLVSYSEATRRPYSLFPTPRAPALLMSGVTMHRIRDVDPVEDTRRKIATLAPVSGVVLDTATGLGYTATAAAKTAERVVTIELDPEVLELARLNPWSRELFDDPKIEQRIGDACELIGTFENQSFQHIIHDPPMITLAGDMYSTAFYRELYRVLRPGGRLFHYIGDPESPGGRNTTRGVLRRLQELGFRRVVPRPEAFGVVASK